MDKKSNSKKTIIVLSHVNIGDDLYCSFVHSHAREYVKLGYNVIVYAPLGWFPIISNFQKNKRERWIQIKKQGKKEIIDGVTIIYKKIMSFSNLLYNSSINLNGIFYYNSIKKMFNKIYKKEDIVFIDAHTFKVEGYAAYKLKKKYPSILTTVTLHGTSFNRNITTKNGIKLIKNIFNKVDYAICVSEKFKKVLERINVKNAKVIFNGNTSYDIEPVDKKLNKYNIISVGSLDFGKRHDITIKAVKELIQDYPLIKLTIVGEGKDRESLENLINELKMNNYIELKGNIKNNEVIGLMNRSNIFLLPSINEGFGIVYLEAMRSGAIAIGTKNEGIDGFIKNEENGFLVNSNVNEIVELIKNIYQDKYDIEKIRNKAYEDAKQATWEKNAREYISLLE